MYNVKLSNYMTAPVPANSDRIVAAHYYAAWKKGAAGIHDGFNFLHEFPERTPLMGYYDEENPEVCDWEIKWAVEHGINCFIHCWYRKLDNMGKPVTVNDIRCGHGLHEALFNAKYQEMMKFAIMFENSPRWGSTDSKDMVENLMPFWVENYFSRDNYLKIDNKPVLFVFADSRLSTQFANPAEQKATFDACREYAKGCGFDGMIIALCNTVPTKEANDDSIAKGYDFRFGYGSGYVPENDYPPEEDIIKGQCDIVKRLLAVDNKRFVPTVSCFLDTTPRHSKHWRDLGYEFHLCKIWHLDPSGFRKILRNIKEITAELPDDSYGKKILMIDNWNEWDEGHYVAPSHEFGFRYLQAVREELTDRNNLPDYRMPQDLGFDGYNTSWEIPDFKEFCAERLKNSDK